MKRFPTSRRIGGLIVVLLALASRVEAGSPLLCFPFDPGGSAVLPWNDGYGGWNSPDPRYDRRRLVSDVLRLLSPDAPVLARMENLRRATIYAGENPRLAADLLAALLDRTRAAGGSASPDPLALFDAGYLVETYGQARLLSRAAAALAGERRADAAKGYALVLEAIRLTGGMPAMEYAASLMTSGSTSAEHRRRASSAPPAGSPLAWHLSRW
jgi:hypothetical protein